MEKSYLKIDQSIKDAIITSLSATAQEAFVKSVKEAGDTGTFDVIISTDDIDRAGEMIKQDGWDLTNYMKSPVVLWGHNYQQPPIGICTSIEKTANGLKASGKFAPTEFAQEIRKLYDLGMCRATSVGFIPTEQEGNIITKAELLEFSFVSVPANPYALSLRDIYSISQETAGMVVKSILNIVKGKKDAEAAPAADEKKPDEVTPPAPAKEGEPAPAPETEQKGAVADTIAADEAMDMKYENMEDVWEIMSAFCEVYFNEETKVEDFSKLLTETIAILSTVADGTYTDPDDMSEEDAAKSAIITAVKGFDAKRIALIREAVKTAKMRNEPTVKISVFALESILAKSEEGSEGKGDDTSLTPDAVEAKGLLEAKSILQNVSTILGDSLFKIKSIAKKEKLY